MSQANLELVRAAYEWGNGRRELDLDDVLDPAFEWHTRVDLADAGVRRGHEGATRLRAEWVEAFEDFHIEIDELIDAGDFVIAVSRLCGRPRDGTRELSLPETQVWKLRAGKAVEVRAYLTRDEALKAVRLADA
jgi:ketosteroid isomerase-like protein